MRINRAIKASVNHLHLHSMNLQKELGMDSCPSVSCSKKGFFRRLAPQSHLEGFVINVDSRKDIEEIVSNIDTLVVFFHRNEIPYNTLWVRGRDPEIDSS